MDVPSSPADPTALQIELRRIAIPQIALGSVGALLAGFLGLVALAHQRARTQATDSPEAFLAFLVMLLCGAAAAGGFGLLARRPWALSVVTVAATSELLLFPIGTAIGLRTLWRLYGKGVADAIRPVRFWASGPHAAPAAVGTLRRTPVVGLLVTMGAFGATIVVGLHTGFALEGRQLPRELEGTLVPAVVFLVFALGYGAHALFRLWLRRRARLALHALAGPLAPRRGSAEGVVTCEHLMGLEAVLRVAGVRVLPRSGRHAEVSAALEQGLLRAHGPLAPCVVREEVPAVDRSLLDPAVTRLRCTECDASLTGSAGARAAIPL